jgi:hypothetical protein
MLYYVGGLLRIQVKVPLAVEGLASCGDYSGTPTIARLVYPCHSRLKGLMGSQGFPARSQLLGNIQLAAAAVTALQPFLALSYWLPSPEGEHRQMADACAKQEPAEVHQVRGHV